MPRLAGIFFQQNDGAYEDVYHSIPAFRPIAVIPSMLHAPKVCEECLLT